MELYTEASTLPNVLWSEPMETAWQWLTTGPSVPGSKIPHMSIADQLFVAAVANTPRPARPWGAITWLSSVFQISRPTVYDLGKRAARGLERSLGGRPVKERSTPAPVRVRCPSGAVGPDIPRAVRAAVAGPSPGGDVVLVDEQGPALRPMGGGVVRGAGLSSAPLSLPSRTGKATARRS